MEAPLYKNYSKHTNYHHEIDAYTPNSSTIRVQKQTIRRLSSEKQRSLTTTTLLKKNRRDQTYNKWYINPELHFVAQSKDPKNDKKMLNDEQHVYKNLRNPQFWNWIHPFDTKHLPNIKPSYNIEKIDSKTLQGFKKYIEQSATNKRLPSIVEHILNQKNKNKLLAQKD